MALQSFRLMSEIAICNLEDICTGKRHEIVFASHSTAAQEDSLFPSAHAFKINF